MNKNILTINNLSKSYYTKEREILALDNISLNIEENTITSIVGPSGCGKSTLLNIIGNLETKTKGEISFQENKNKIGYMFQNDCLFPWLTILENCLLGLKIQKQLTKENIEYVKELLNNYGLKDFINSYPNNLSGGMKQRVSLARAFLKSSPILLLDEPTKELDPKLCSVVCDLIKAESEKRLVIVVTHKQDDLHLLGGIQIDL